MIEEETRLLLNEMSIRQIKGRIFDILQSDEAQQYKLDEFNYENIPLSIFEQNGITMIHLKQYDMSNDIVTFDLGININPIKKDVDVFIQRQGIFNEQKNMKTQNKTRKNMKTQNKEALLREYIRKYIKESMSEIDGEQEQEELNEVSFSRQHYNAIANIIANSESKKEIAYALADIFSKDNPLFKRNKFLQAAGIL